MKPKEHIPVIIVGGGISGLATAWYLHKVGIPFKLIEKRSKLGGAIQSTSGEHAVFDFGPNSIRDKDGTIRELISDIGLFSEMITISEAFKTRYIVRNGKLSKLSPTPLSFFSSDILSSRGKLRLIRELFVAPSDAEEDECVASFLERRIGQEAVDYLVDPFFSGIYAGDIYKLSKRSLLDKFAIYEQEFGSITRGMIKSKKGNKNNLKPLVLSFKKGIQSLTEAIHHQLSEFIIREEVTRIDSNDECFIIHTSAETYSSDKVITCIPAYALSGLINHIDDHLANTLSNIAYPPMMSTQLIYNEQDIAAKENGFGFLVPRKENIRLLGAIWKTNIFPELTENGHAHFNLMTGGSHDTSILSEDTESIEQEVIAEFSKLMGISSHPLTVESKIWEKAIPQFEVGYEEVKNEFNTFEDTHPGFHIGGNFAWGISVPDCISGGKKLAHLLQQLA